MTSVIAQFIEFKLKFLAKRILELAAAILFLFDRKYSKMPDFRKILIIHIRPMGLGDLLMNTPAIRALAKHYRKAKISILTDVPGIVRGNRYISEIIQYDPGNIANLKSIIKSKNFDTLFFFNKSANITLFSYLFSIPYKIGFIFDWKVRANFPILKKKFRFTKEHYTNMGLRVLESVGIKSNNMVLEEMRYSRNDRQYVDSFLRKEKAGRRFIVVNPNALWLSKAWPLYNYAALMNKINKNLDISIVIIGVRGDAAIVNRLKSSLKFKIINAAGRFNLNQLAYLLKKAELFITNDAGPMHISLSVRTPTISLFGPTNPNILVSPLKNNKSKYIFHRKSCHLAPCYNGEHAPVCPYDFKCMKAIKPEEVYEIVKKMLKKK